MSTDDVDLGLDLLVDRWLPVPAPDDDVAAQWAATAAQELCALDDQPQEVDRLTGQLRLWAQAPERAGHDVVAVLVPEAAAGVYAWLTVVRLAVEPATLDELEARALSGSGVGGLDVARVALPAGPAVRSRGVLAAPRDDGLGELVEQVQWLVLSPLLAPPGSGAGVVLELTTSWTAAAAHEADDLAQLADDIAQTLTVRPRE